MKIAINAPVWLKVPPDGYGGIEMITGILADELTRMGHDVTLFASGDSETCAKLKYIYEKPQGWRMHNCIPELLHSCQAFLEAKNFDIIHDHTYCGPPLAYFVETPVLCTLHGDFNEDSKRYYSTFNKAGYFNSISHFQVKEMPQINYVGNVYNTIDINKYIYNEKKEDFLLFVSRISPQKGTHIAIKAALDTNNKLIIAGKIDPGEDLRYFKDSIEPLIDDKNIIYMGEISLKKKLELMSKAKAFLFPIQWAEPFGLVMIEALASGTPVIAMNNGSVPEVLNEKVGFVANDYDSFVSSISKVNTIDPKNCRKHVAKNFSPEKMTADYMEIYERICNSKKNLIKALDMV